MCFQKWMIQLRLRRLLLLSLLLLLLLKNSQSQSTNKVNGSDNDMIVCPISNRVDSSTYNIQTFEPETRNNNEISGIAFSLTIQYRDNFVLYGINDGSKNENENRARLIIWDSGTGARLRTLRMPGVVTNTDWEDLTIGSCGSSRSDNNRQLQRNCLYMADTGDNRARNSNGVHTQRPENRPYQIIKVIEPVWSDYNDYDEIPISSISILPFEYSDPSSPTQYADSESLFLDHTGWGSSTSTSTSSPGDLYFATKWNANVRQSLNRLFLIPALAWQHYAVTMTAADTVLQVSRAAGGQYHAPVAVGNYDDANDQTNPFMDSTWTRAEMTADGTVIALGGMEETQLFLRCPGQSVADVLLPSRAATVTTTTEDSYQSSSSSNRPCHGWPIAPQGSRPPESFAWTPDGFWTLQIAEGANAAMTWTEMLYDASQSSQLCPATAATLAPTLATPMLVVPPTLAPTFAPTFAPTLALNVPPPPTTTPTQPPTPPTQEPVVVIQLLEEIVCHDVITGQVYPYSACEEVQLQSPTTTPTTSIAFTTTTTTTTVITTQTTTTTPPTTTTYVPLSTTSPPIITTPTITVTSTTPTFTPSISSTSLTPPAITPSPSLPSTTLAATTTVLDGSSAAMTPSLMITNNNNNNINPGSSSSFPLPTLITLSGSVSISRAQPKTTTTTTTAPTTSQAPTGQRRRHNNLRA